MANPTVELDIEALGLRGDGVARLEDGTPVFVPYTLPGERVRARIQSERGAGLVAKPLEILAPAPDRAAPACRHFGRCGGCALQHLKAGTYRAWKEEVIRAALERQGFDDPPLDALTTVPPGARRRADFTAVRRERDLVFGFNEAGSRTVIDLEECPILLPDLVALLPPLRQLLTDILRKGDKADVVATMTETGVDLLLVTRAALKLPEREAIAAFAEDRDIARIARRLPREIGAEPIVERRKPIRTFGATPVALPPGAFLQATAEGEAALTAFVLEACAGARRIADLYAGCGTFSFALAEGDAAVHAVEGDGPAHKALVEAARSAALNRVTAERRDLAKRPLRVEELNRFDAVVFDPPRAGAKEQAVHLAESKVKTVVAVSCHPGTFARDARILAEGGYRLERVHPVDQFLWSPHLELAAHFRR